MDQSLKSVDVQKVIDANDHIVNPDFIKPLIHSQHKGFAEEYEFFFSKSYYAVSGLSEFGWVNFAVNSEISSEGLFSKPTQHSACSRYFVASAK